MKSSIYIFVALLATLFMTSCGKKDSSNTRIRGGNGGVGIQQGYGINGQPQMSMCANGQQATGYITPTMNSYNYMNNFNTFDTNTGMSTMTDDPFTSTVKDYLSFIVSPNEVGSVSSSNGVTINLAVSGSNGQVNGQASSLNITIADSLVGRPLPSTGQIAQPMTVSYSGNATGTVNRQTGALNITFNGQDSIVTLSGNINNQSAQGTISYSLRNGNQGTLGTFNVPSCSFNL